MINNIIINNIMNRNLSKDIIISIMRFMDNASIRVLSTINKYFNTLIRNNQLMVSYGFGHNIYIYDFTELVIKSDNLDLFKKYVNYDSMEITKMAAENGAINILKYAHENGCDWDIQTCEMAAENGHLECLKYAHENGCDWNKNTCKLAAKNGHLKCLKYAHKNGCPGSDDYVYLLKN